MMNKMARGAFDYMSGHPVGLCGLRIEVEFGNTVLYH